MVPRLPVRADAHSGAGGADALAENVPLVPGAAGEGLGRAQAGLAATHGARRGRVPAHPRGESASRAASAVPCRQQLSFSISSSFGLWWCLLVVGGKGGLGKDVFGFDAFIYFIFFWLAVAGHSCTCRLRWVFDVWIFSVQGLTAK